jgi:hypothetical protein
MEQFDYNSNIPLCIFMCNWTESILAEQPFNYFSYECIYLLAFFYDTTWHPFFNYWQGLVAE